MPHVDFERCTSKSKETRKIRNNYIITFRVGRSRGEMYIGHARLCVRVSACLFLAAFPHYCTDPDVTWGMEGGAPSCAHYWNNLQSAHGFRCYDN